MAPIIINRNKNFAYRISHVHNLPHILQAGLCTKHHPKANPHFISIGNPSILSTRDTTPVKIAGYGNIGDYVPFYFTPRSIMLYNIVTGYYAPVVPRVAREDILVVRCLIKTLATTPRFFFTDGQANDAFTNHYNQTHYGKNIDWDSIQTSNFSKSDGDFDRQRRYQAEFLVHQHVPLSMIESLCVYNRKAATFVQSELEKAGITTIPIHIQPAYYF
ncbi:MAG: type II toxin-antitoxin system toxin DNA ADP-ribosyl transferase DarT [Segetibacter sp.]